MEGEATKEAKPPIRNNMQQVAERLAENRKDWGTRNEHRGTYDEAALMQPVVDEQVKVGPNEQDDRLMAFN